MQPDPPPDIPRRVPLWAAVILCVGALGAGAVVLPMLRLDPVPRVVQAPDLSAPAPQTGVPTGPAEPEPDPRAPRFDLVRAAADGRIIVAGRAQPGALVGLVVDGVALAETRSDGAGLFVAFLTLDPSAAARVLWLVTQDDAGGVVASEDTVILAPDAPARATQVAPAPLSRSADDRAPAAVDPAPDPAPAPDPPATSVELGLAASARLDEAARVAAADPAPAETAVAPAPPDPPADSRPGPSMPLVSGSGGVRVAVSAPLSGAALRLDSIDYGAEGAVVLRGRAAPGGVVRARLSDLPPVEIAPDADGLWTLHLRDVAPGEYRLDIARVAEPDSPGASGTDRITLPFRRAAPEDVSAALSGEAARIVTVQPGATLWAIARDRYGDGGRFVQVYAANRGAIRDPDLIYPGQVFRLPDAPGHGPVARPIDVPR